MSPNSFLLSIRGKLLDLSDPIIMGILNLTPDSFSDGGKFNNEKDAINQVEKMIREGATIIDIGAQSTKPNASKLNAAEEIMRLGQIISMVKEEFPDILISLDTFFSEVVKFGFDQGIDIINDISAGQFDDEMLKTVRHTQLPYILMHVNSSYEEMHLRQIKDDIILTLNYFISKKINELNNLGIKDIILDPGFGFGKSIAQQFQMMEKLEHIGFQNYPLLVGISRKSFIYKSLGKSPLEIGTETQKFHLKALQKGAKILRVHDVRETQKIIDEFLEFN